MDRTTPITILPPIDYDDFVDDDSTLWPEPGLAFRHAHLSIVHLARRRMVGRAEPWIEADGWFHASDAEFRVRADHLEIDTYDAIGIRIRRNLLETRPEDRDPGPALDRLLAVIALADEGPLETWAEKHFSAWTHYARPLASDAAEGTVNTLGMVMSALAVQADPIAPRRVEILRRFQSQEGTCEVWCDGDLDDSDLTTAPEVSSIVSSLPEAHGYSFDPKPDWRAAGQRSRYGTPRFGWVVLEARRSAFAPTQPGDVVTAMRAIREGTPLLRQAGIDLSDALETVDLTDADADAKQDPVQWPGIAMPGPTSPLELRASPCDPDIVDLLVEALDQDARQFGLVYSRRPGGLGPAWRALNGRGPWAASLEDHQIEGLVAAGLMVQIDRGRIAATTELVDLIAASRPWHSALLPPGPILPGTRIAGSEGAKVRHGHLVRTPAGIVFVEALTPREGRTQAARRVGARPRDVLATAFAVAGSAWVNSAFEDAQPPEPWATMLEAGWEMRARTHEAVHLIETALRADPGFDVSGWMRDAPST